jgi:FixJ family two-component response regulator
MKTARNSVFVVEDDPSMRQALRNLLRSVGLNPQLFASAEEFLKSELPSGPRCLILDVRLPGMSGLDLQRQLLNSNVQIPIIFITAHGDTDTSARARQAGAIDFLIKPFRDQDLFDAIDLSLAQDRLRL